MSGLGSEPWPSQLRPARPDSGSRLSPGRPSSRARSASHVRSPLAPLPTTYRGLHGHTATSRHPPPRRTPRGRCPRALFVVLGAPLLASDLACPGMPFPRRPSAGDGSATQRLRQGTPSTADSRPLAPVRTSSDSGTTGTSRGSHFPRPGERSPPCLWLPPRRASRASPRGCHASHLSPRATFPADVCAPAQPPAHTWALSAWGRSRGPAGRQPGFAPRLGARRRTTRFGSGCVRCKRSLNGRAPGAS